MNIKLLDGIERIAKRNKIEKYKQRNDRKKRNKRQKYIDIKDKKRWNGHRKRITQLKKGKWKISCTAAKTGCKMKEVI